VDEVLRWAPYPLATAEVAVLREVDLDEAEAELGPAAAHADGRGYWCAPERAAALDKP
jgi:hypothetical protein